MGMRNTYVTRDEIIGAIRKNGLDQAFFELISKDKARACAWGQALLNLEEEKGIDKYRLQYKLSNLPTRYPSICPQCLGEYGYVDDFIVHLNDYHKFSLEKIADIVEDRTPSFKIQVQEGVLRF